MGKDEFKDGMYTLPVPCDLRPACEIICARVLHENATCTVVNLEVE